jgi:hypothetical protein
MVLPSVDWYELICFMVSDRSDEVWCTGTQPLLCRMQCSTYTCGAGFTADPTMQNTACSGGTCTDGFCCQPLVRDQRARRCPVAAMQLPASIMIVNAVCSNPHAICCVLLQCSGHTCGANWDADASKLAIACPSSSCSDSFCCLPQVELQLFTHVHTLLLCFDCPCNLVML